MATHPPDDAAALGITDGSDDRLEISLASAERKAMLVTDRPSLSNACVAGCAMIYALVDKLSLRRGANSKKKFRSMYPVELMVRFFRTYPRPFPNVNSVRSVPVRLVCLHRMFLPDIYEIAR